MNSYIYRLKVCGGLLAGLRRHDFRAARTFMDMNWPDDSLLIKHLKFIPWTLRQMLVDIPDALTTVAIDRNISHIPAWLCAENPLKNYPWCDFPDTKLPDSADTVVIGAGMTGSAFAYHWSRKVTDDRKLVILEMDDAASGSSGRNEGLIVMGRYYYMMYKNILASLSKLRADLTDKQRDKLAHKFAAVYVKAAYRNGDLIAETIKKEKLDCGYKRNGWVQAKDTDEEVAVLDETVRMGKEAGFSDWTRIEAEEVRKLTGMNATHAAGYSVGAASCHPAKYVWELLRVALKSKAVNYYSRTKVNKVEDAGDYYIVHTSRGLIRAKHVVNAMEAYTSLLHKQFKGKLFAVQTQAATGEGGPDNIVPDRGISGTRAFFGKHGDAVMVGSDATRIPDREIGRIQPSRFLTKYLCGEMKRLYGKFNFRIKNEWSGSVGFTDDEYPIIGTMDGKEQYIIGGMCGSGSGVSFNAARCICNRILGIDSEPDDYPEEFFGPTRILAPDNHKWPEV